MQMQCIKCRGGLDELQLQMLKAEVSCPGNILATVLVGPALPYQTCSSGIQGFFLLHLIYSVAWLARVSLDSILSGLGGAIATSAVMH
jgi:hypothetical protein